jgi:hypothetical protein
LLIFCGRFVETAWIENITRIEVVTNIFVMQIIRSIVVCLKQTGGRSSDFAGWAFSKHQRAEPDLSLFRQDHPFYAAKWHVID